MLKSQSVPRNLTTPVMFGEFLLNAKRQIDLVATVYDATGVPGSAFAAQEVVVRVLHSHLAEDDDISAEFQAQGDEELAQSGVVIGTGKADGTPYWVLTREDGRRLAAQGQPAALRQTLPNWFEPTSAEYNLRWQNRSISVGDLIRYSSELAIPAFQRGAVWATDPGAAASLFRSLARGYFIGTLLYVVKLNDFSASTAIWPGTDPRVLLLDGQQRLRALLGLLPRVDRHGFVHGKLWCVRETSEGVLDFGRHEFPIKAGTKGWIPLALLPEIRATMPEAGGEPPVGYLSGEGSGSIEPCTWTLSDWQKKYSESKIPKQSLLLGFLNARVQQHMLEITELPAVIDNYRRLNQSGSRLREEELEYARLVGICGPVVQAALTDLSLLWTTDTADELEDRDLALQRGRDRDFGLALLIRAVRLARDVGHGEFMETGHPFSDDAGSVHAAQYADYLKEAVACVTCVAKVLQALGCDYRGAIPPRASVFGALLTLLLRFPELRDEASELMQGVVLGMFLARTDVPAEKVAWAASAEDAVLRLRDWISERQKDELRSTDAPSKSADALVHVFYWYLRKDHANPANDIHRTEERQLKCDLNPQRQHIIPFNRVDFGAARITRSDTHYVNSVGNLTWISEEANHFKPPGWGDSFMQASGIGHAAHLLEGPPGADFSYTEASLPFFKNSEKMPVTHLEQFVKARGKLVTSELWAWFDQLAEQPMPCVAVQPDRRANEVPLFMELATRGCDPDAARLLHQVIHRLAYSDSTASGWLKGAHARFRYRSKLKLILSASKPTLELDYRDAADEKQRTIEVVVGGPVVRLPEVGTGGEREYDITNHSPELEPFVQCLKRLFHGWELRDRPDEFRSWAGKLEMFV